MNMLTGFSWFILVMVSHEDNNETSSSIKGTVFLDQPSDYHKLRQDPAQLSWLVEWLDD